MSALLVVRCADPRHEKEWRPALEEAFQGVGGWYTNTFLGSVKDLIEKQGATDGIAALRQIQRTVELGGVTEIALIQHGDCRAYRLEGCTFSDAASEESFQVTQLRRARSVLVSRLSGVTVNLYYLDNREHQIKQIPPN